MPLAGGLPKGKHCGVSMCVCPSLTQDQDMQSIGAPETENLILYICGVQNYFFRENYTEGTMDFRTSTLKDRKYTDIRIKRFN